jgi:hypothetical protein
MACFEAVIRRAHFAKFDVLPLGQERLGSNLNMEIFALKALAFTSFIGNQI